MFYLTYVAEILYSKTFKLINNKCVVLKWIQNILKAQDFYVIQSYG